MSKPFNPNNPLDSSERADAEFGINEGFDAYMRLIQTDEVDPSKLIPEIADQAIRLAMVLEHRVDVDITQASRALIRRLEEETTGSQ